MADSQPSDFNARVIDEFRSNGGKVGGMFEGSPLLLLHHVGARSGEQRITPLVYLADGERYAIFASKAGAPSHPAWFHNLKASPDVEIEVGTERLAVRASEASGQERDRVYEAQKQRMPQFAEYEQKTDRVIPVVLLTPA
ncbi:MAG: nitroreductase family deazaflavin-dependent oxidoreductase [Solirubrobacteraceae bacterium]